MRTLITTISAGLFAASLIASAHAGLAPNTAGLSGSTAVTPVTVVAVDLPAR
jgi:hypothetical protein